MREVSCCDCVKMLVIGLDVSCGLTKSCPADHYAYYVSSGYDRNVSSTICFNGNEYESHHSSHLITSLLKWTGLHGLDWTVGRVQFSSVPMRLDEMRSVSAM